MATPDFVLELRRHVGHAPLWMPGTTVVVMRSARADAPIDWESPIDPGSVEILCVRRSDNGAWTPVTGIVDPGEEPALAAAREAKEETDVDIDVRRLLSVEVVGPVTYDNGDVTTYLDVAHQLEILDLVRELNDERGLTVVMVLHDLTQTARYCDNAVLMTDGRVRATGAPARALDAETIEQVFGVDTWISADPVSGQPVVVPRSHRATGPGAPPDPAHRAGGHHGEEKR